MMKSRNEALDLVKGISCFAVVLFHVPFPGSFGTMVNTSTRFAVPFFFMVSGYFAFNAGDGQERNRKHTLHVLKIVALSSIIYFFLHYLFNLWGDQTNSQMGDVGALNAKGILFFVLFNKPVIIVGQLWFLFALLYDYILYDLFDRNTEIESSYVLIPVFLVLYIFLAQGMHLMGYKVENCIYRNFLIEGMPFFLLGHLIHFRENQINFSKKLLIAVIAVSTVGCCAERAIMGRAFGVNICTIPQVIAIFCYCVEHPQLRDVHGLKIMSIVGEKLSLLVYVIHPFVWRFVNYIYQLGMEDLWDKMNWIKPILVLFITLMLSLAANWIKTTLIQRYKRA